MEEYAVIKLIDDTQFVYYFDTKKEAVDYVSAEYLANEKAFVDSGRFNCACTQTEYICDEDQDVGCKPYDINLKHAYIDGWDATWCWYICKESEVGRLKKLQKKMCSSVDPSEIETMKKVEVTYELIRRVAKKYEVSDEEYQSIKDGVLPELIETEMMDLCESGEADYEMDWAVVDAETMQVLQDWE